MALKLSTGLVNKLMGMQGALKAFIQGTSLAAVDGGGSDDSYTDSGNGFITAGFAPNDLIWVRGTVSNNGVSGVALKTVTAGTITVVTGTVTTETFPDAGCIIGCKGGSVRDVFQDGVLRICSGAAPSSADAAQTGTVLATITLSSGAFTPGSFTNGLEFGAAAAGVIAKVASETWSATAAAAGTAVYYRLVANATDDGSLSTTLPRIQGTVGVGSSYDLNLSSTTIALSDPITISSFTYTMSPS